MSTGEFVPPTPEELDALLPDCTVESLIAQGGMGAIYRGLQTKLDRPVAIKVLPKSFGADLDYASRFEQEAKAMAKLSHNNIVGVYDYGETSDGALLYFIMEFVEGSDLFARLHEDTIDYNTALPLLIQICDALHYAHTNGIVHRDIKPANILIDTTNTVKMADFGLAKVQLGGVDPDGAESGTAFGTPDYIAPEALVEGVEVDHRADIYSLGVVIYEVLTGEIPKGTFHLPSALNPTVDRRLDDLIVKAMAHDREDRFADVDEIKNVLIDVERTPRLVAGAVGGAAAPALATAGNTGRVSVGAGAARNRPPLSSAKSSSSNATLIITLVLLLLIGGGGAFYFFAVKPGQDASKQLAKVAPETRMPHERDPASPPEKVDPVPDPDPDPKPAPPPPPKPPEPEPEPEPETDEPTPEPITPIPYAGTVRFFGSMLNVAQVNLSPLDGIDDVITIRARDSNYHALRANGETISSDPAHHGMSDIRWLDARKRFVHEIGRDGSLWFSKNKQLFPGVITNAIRSGGGGGGGGHGEALLADGSLVVWGGMYGSDNNTLGEPFGEYKDLVDIASAPNVVALLDKNGTVFLYNNNKETAVREPLNDADRIVEIESGGGDFVALTKSGRAFSWSGIRFSALHGQPSHVKEGYFIKVRGGSAVRAAQKADGTWLAWGNKKWGIIDKIESLPPTPEIAMAVYTTIGHVFWIEPNPAYMPGPGNPATTMPGTPGEPVPDVDPSTLSGADRYVAELRQKVRKRHGQMVQQPYLEALARLNEQYISALERSGGGPELDRARKAIAGGGDTPPVLVAPSTTSAVPLENTYRREHAKLTEQRDTNGRAVLNTFVSDLEILETEVNGSLGAPEAAKVRAAIESAQGAGLNLFESP